MQVLITGGTGFVGSHLVSLFLERGHHVTVTGTRPAWPGAPHERLAYLAADTREPGDWQTAAGEARVIVNLAGRSIFKRWSRAYKQEIYDSRVLTTRNLAAAVTGDHKVTFLSTSAIGFYGDGGEKTLDESAPAGEDFLAGVCRDWEAAAQEAAGRGARVSRLRFGVVLGKGGGALAQMLPPFRFGLGGPVGGGQQWFPWIHMTDLAAVIGMIIDNDALEGAFNLVSPGALRNADFARALGSALKRPALLPVPRLALKLAMGELGDALTASQRAKPQRLLDAGFRFRFAEIGGH
jgi:uncharacterized protein (TIGR01777 family)